MGDFNMIRQNNLINESKIHAAWDGALAHSFHKELLWFHHLANIIQTELFGGQELTVKTFLEVKKS